MESGDRVHGVHFIKFSIPVSPVSCNSLYNVMFAMRKVELKPEIRLWKSQVKQFVPPWNTAESGYMYFNADIYTETLFKNGKVRKLDLQNLEKALIDAVCEKLGVGDEFIFQKFTRKIQGEKDRIDVEIGFLDTVVRETKTSAVSRTKQEN